MTPDRLPVVFIAARPMHGHRRTIDIPRNFRRLPVKREQESKS